MVCLDGHGSRSTLGIPPGGDTGRYSIRDADGHYGKDGTIDDDFVSQLGKFVRLRQLGIFGHVGLGPDIALFLMSIILA